MFTEDNYVYALPHTKHLRFYHEILTGLSRSHWPFCNDQMAGNLSSPKSGFHFLVQRRELDPQDEMSKMR